MKESKQCEMCGKEMPNARSTKKYCDECRREIHRIKNKEWMEENPEEYKKSQKKYYLANRKKILEGQKKYNKKYYKTNRDKRDEYARRYYINNRERILEKSRENSKKVRQRKKELQRKRTAVIFEAYMEHLKEDYDDEGSEDADGES